MIFINVGDTFSSVDHAIQDFPDGTILLAPDGTARTVNSKNLGVYDGGPYVAGQHTLLHLPQVKPATLLAAELRSVWRGEDMTDVTPDWERVAEFVEENFKRNSDTPMHILDGEGDVWEHQESGEYMLMGEGDNLVFESRDQIRKDYGIRAEF